MKKQGFTMVELLVVLVILAIIMIISIIAVFGHTNRARERNYENLKITLRSAAEAYVLKNYRDVDDMIVTLANLCLANMLECPVYNPRTRDNLDETRTELRVVIDSNGVMSTEILNIE